MARLNPTNFGYQNFYSATLTGDITAGTLTIGVDTVPTPTSGILVIEPDSTTAREVILYTSKGASTITCPSDGRGFSGSTAGAHLQGSQVIMAPVDRWFTALASGELSTDPLRTEQFFDYVASGLVWTADAAGSTRNASMTSGVMYIGGRRLTLPAVTARAFTASRDTYIDVADNLDGTGIITYSEVTNNAASPALATNNVRIGIIVTGASNIAAAGSVNQGELTKVLPIASGVAYTFTDSLGNIICPRDPNRRILGYKQIVSGSPISVGSAETQIAGLSSVVKIPTGRKAKITLTTNWSRPVNAFGDNALSIWNGTVGSGIQIKRAQYAPVQTGSTKTPTPPVTGMYDSTGATSDTFNASVWSRSMAARFPEDWRENKGVEVTGANGGPVEMRQVTFVAPDGK